MSPDFVLVETGDIRLRVAVVGKGPLVLLVHGFPESWYSWRHQMPAIAQAGYRVAAMDVRGYGGSSRPHAVAAYRLEALASDCLAVARALSPGDPVILVGHDWGAPIVWTAALVHSEEVRAVAGLAVPHLPLGDRHALDVARDAFVARGRFFYLDYFQTPGVAEAELDGAPEASLRAMLYAWSGEAPDGFWHNRRPASSRLFDGIDPVPQELPAWLTREDLDHFVAEFEASGFRGPLNRYRNFDDDQRFLQALEKRVIRQPALFIAGDRDPALAMFPSPIVDAIKPGYADLRAVHILPGVGHWTQQEAPKVVNRLLLDWLATV